MPSNQFPDLVHRSEKTGSSNTSRAYYKSVTYSTRSRSERFFFALVSFFLSCTCLARRSRAESRLFSALFLLSWKRRLSCAMSHFARGRPCKNATDHRLMRRAIPGTVKYFSSKITRNIPLAMSSAINVRFYLRAFYKSIVNYC